MDKLTRQLYIDKKTFVRIFKENWDRYKELCGCRKVKDDNLQRLLDIWRTYLYNITQLYRDLFLSQQIDT